MKTLLFSFEGRINRAKYWLTVLAIAIVLDCRRHTGTDLMARARRGPAAARDPFRRGRLRCRACRIGIAAGIKRLHDREKSGWWLLVFYARAGSPQRNRAAQLAASSRACVHSRALAISIWMIVELGCLKGTTGPNTYGPDPLPPASWPAIPGLAASGRTIAPVNCCAPVDAAVLRFDGIGLSLRSGRRPGRMTMDLTSPVPVARRAASRARRSGSAPACLIVWGIVVFVVLWTILGPSLVQNFLGRLSGFPFTLLTHLLRLQSCGETLQRSRSPDHLRAGGRRTCGAQIDRSTWFGSPATCMRRTGWISCSSSAGPASRSGSSSSSA